MHTLTVSDSTATGDVLRRIELEFASEEITLRELIAARVTQEVAAYNERQSSGTHMLVTPTSLEKALNLRKPRTVDAEKQVYVALQAFQENGYFVLINDAQVEDLEQPVRVHAQTAVEFVKLTPLVGG